MIPTYLEQLIHQGKAEHKTFSGAVAEELVLTVPDKTYAIIYEYWYKPLLSDYGAEIGAAATVDFSEMLQYVNFYNTETFQAYWHEVAPDYVIKNHDNIPTENPTAVANYIVPSTKQTDYRSCYIKTSRDISIYFTKAIIDDMVFNTGAVPAIEPLSGYFGYANPLLLITRLIQNYHENGGVLGNYLPLQEFITRQVVPAARPDFVNMVYSLPFFGGAIPSPTAWAGLGTDALGKIRAQHFQCNYVLINAENPKNLI